MTKLDRSQFSVKKLSSRYYDAVVSIDKECGENFWNRDDFKKQCRKDDSSVYVLLHKSIPVGFVAYEYMKVEGEIHVLNMGLRAKYRRNKLGTMLLNRVKSKLAHSYNLLQVVVRETNLGAQLFLKNNGFRAKLLRRYFVDHFQNETKVEDGFCFEFCPQRVANFEKDGNSRSVGFNSTASGVCTSNRPNYGVGQQPSQTR